MAILPLLPISGAAIAPLAAKVVERAWGGIPFADVLRRPNTSAASQSSQIVDRATHPGGGVEPQLADSAGVSYLRGSQPGRYDDLARFVHLLRQRLRAEGIDLAQPIRLKSDARGGVIVDGNHPDRAAIEQLFAADKPLKDAFHALDATFAAEERTRHYFEGGIRGQFVLRLAQNSAGVAFE